MFQLTRLPSFATRALLTGVGALALTSCDPDQDTAPVAPVDPNAKDGSRVYVINEGKFGTPNGAVSLFSKTSKTVVDKNLFFTVNKRELGDVVQSMQVVGQRGYLVVNNSKKVEVVSLPSFESVATVTGLEQPRYLAAVSADQAYVSEWVQYGAPGRVAVLDLRTNTVTKTIPVGRQPEQLLFAKGKVYVPNSDENTLSVINPATNTVESTITVADGPQSLVQDKTGTIWVLCSGITRYGPAPDYNVVSSTPGSLVKLNAAGTGVQTTLAFASGSPSGLRLNGTGDQLYYRHRGGVYRLATTDATLPTAPLIRRSFYGFDIDPQDNTIYASIASFTTTGRFIRYQSNGALIDSFEVNIGPNGFVFY